MRWAPARSSFASRSPALEQATQNRGRGKKTQTSIKQVLAPLFVAMSDQSHQLPRRVQRKRPRPPLQFDSSLFRRAIALAVVARVAASHQIFPRRTPAPRTRHHVIQRQLRSRERPRAELASISVAQQNVLPRKRAALLRNVPVTQQPNHRRHLNRFLRGMYFGVVGFFGLRDAL